MVGSRTACVVCCPLSSLPSRSSAASSTAGAAAAPSPVTRERELVTALSSFVLSRFVLGSRETMCGTYEHYARRMGQPTQRATNYTARSNIDTAQIFLHANGQRPKRAPIRQRSQRRQRRGEPHTEHGLGVFLA